MNTYEIVWEDYGNTISRNTVNEDPRPTTVEADSFELFGSPPTSMAFFKEGNDEGFLFINDVPLMVTRVGA